MATLSVVYRITSDIKGLLTGVQQSQASVSALEKRVVTAQQSLRSFGSGATSAGRALSVGLTLPLALVGGAAIRMGMQTVESESLVAASFEGMTDAAHEWSRGLSESLGLNKFEVREQSAVLFEMTKNMGFTKDAAFEMSTGVVELAADMESFRNIPMAEALNKITAGLTGESEPLKRLGILVNEAAVKTFAYTNGIAKQGEALTENQKVMARWQLILKQTSKDQGDLARTIESPTNQLRLMKNRIAEAGAELGLSLMPMFKTLVALIKDSVIPAVQRLVEWFTDLSPEMKRLVIGGMALAAALGPLLIILGSMATGLAALLPILAPIGVVLGALATGPVGLLIAGLATLVLGIVSFRKNLDTMKTKADETGRSLKSLETTINEASFASWNAVKATGEYGLGLQVIDGKIVRVATSNEEMAAAVALTAAELKKAEDKAAAIAEEYGRLSQVVGELERDFNSASFGITAFGVNLTTIGERGTEIERLRQRLDALAGVTTDLIEPTHQLAVTEQMLADALAGIKAPAEEGMSLLDALKDTVNDLNNVFKAAFEGGGGVKGAVKSLFTGLLQGAEDGLNMILPGLGTVVGKFAGAIVAGFSKIFGGLFGNAETMKVNDFRDTFQSAFGPNGVGGTLADMDTAFQKVGLTLDGILAASTMAEWEAATRQYDEAVKAAAASNDALAAASAAAAEAALIDFGALTTMAEQYGITLDGLGPAFQAADITDQATKILDDFDSLKAAGADVGGVLLGMSDEIQDLVLQALRFGTALPEGLRPILENLLAAGLLSDESGTKLEDLSQINFADGNLLSSAEDAVKQIDALDQLLRDFPDRIDTDIFINVHGNVPDLHQGGRLHSGTSFVRPVVAHQGLRTDEIPAILQTGESVLNRGATATLGGPAIDALNSGRRVGGGGGDNRSMVAGLDAVRQEMAMLRQDFTITLPSVLAKSTATALIKAGVR